MKGPDAFYMISRLFFYFPEIRHASIPAVQPRPAKSIMAGGYLMYKMQRVAYLNLRHHQDFLQTTYIYKIRVFPEGQVLCNTQP